MAAKRKLTETEKRKNAELYIEQYKAYCKEFDDPRNQIHRSDNNKCTRMIPKNQRSLRDLRNKYETCANMRQQFQTALDKNETVEVDEIDMTGGHELRIQNMQDSADSCFSLMEVMDEARYQQIQALIKANEEIINFVFQNKLRQNTMSNSKLRKELEENKLPTDIIPEDINGVGLIRRINRVELLISELESIPDIIQRLNNTYQLVIKTINQLELLKSSPHMTQDDIAKITTKFNKLGIEINLKDIMLIKDVVNFLSLPNEVVVYWYIINKKQLLPKEIFIPILTKTFKDYLFSGVEILEKIIKNNKVTDIAVKGLIEQVVDIVTKDILSKLSLKELSKLPLQELKKGKKVPAAAAAGAAVEEEDGAAAPATEDEDVHVKKKVVITIDGKQYYYYKKKNPIRPVRLYNSADNSEVGKYDIKTQRRAFGTRHKRTHKGHHKRTHKKTHKKTHRGSYKKTHRGSYKKTHRGSYKKTHRGSHKKTSKYNRYTKYVVSH
jgi:hypothetical protein